MTNVVGADLYDFGRFMKKRIVYGFLASVFTIALGVLLLPFLLFLETVDLETLDPETLDLESMGLNNIGLLLLLGLGALIGTLGAFIYLIKMLIRLNRAKFSAQNRDLRLSFNLFIFAILVPFIGFFVSNLLLSTLFGIVVDICNLMAFWYYYKYIFSVENAHNTPDGVQKVKNGLNFIIIGFSISILISLLFYLEILEIFSILGILMVLVIAILNLYGQFQIATGTMAIFSKFGGSSHRQQIGYPQTHTNTSFGQRSISNYNEANLINRNYGTHAPPAPSSSPLTEPQTSIRKCPMCDELIPIDAQFCSVCGTKL